MTDVRRTIGTSARRDEAGGMLWISRPEKASGVTSDPDEDTLRELALPLDLVEWKPVPSAKYGRA